ncbi:restriction endonuclease subunit S [Shewanella algae]|uniref:restriction endonuclease subunit S n=1 Tax=Shewanella algae TaxID=38313 RepID=UPI0031F539DC
MTLTQWKSKSLGYILEKIVGGGTPSKAKPQYWDGDIPWASVKDLSSTKLDDTADKISEEGLNNSASNLIPAETIVIPTRMALGKVAITTQAMAINQDLKALFPSKEVCKSYLFQWLIFHAEQIASLGTGSTVKGIRLEQLKKIPFSYPTLKEEQKKIAEVLSTVDKKIDLIDQKIAETEKLKTGLMQKLFSKGVGVQDENGEWQPHAEFQDSIYGNIPKTWKLFKLNQVTDYVDYRGKTPPKVESGTFLVTAKNIKNGFIDYECSKEYIPSELYDDVMSRGKPKLGDVVFTTEAPLGNVALIDRSDVAIAQRVIKFRPKDDICLDSGYLKHFMLSTYFQKELLQNATGSTVLGVKGKRLHVMLVCLPSINEQKVIVDILNEVDRKKHFLELQKAETQQLKKGLMQKLLTGEWRVPVEETEAA